MTSITLTHGDLDGIAAGAITLMAFPGSGIVFTRPSQLHQDLFRLAKDEPELVSISDIALNSAAIDDILRAIGRFPSTTKIYWTDHHPISDRHRRLLSQRVEYFNESGCSASELVFRRFGSGLPETALRLALYGAIGDYCDDSPFAVTRLEDYDKRTLYFEAGILVQALQEIEHQKESRDLVYQLALGIQPSAMNDLVALAVKATRIENEVYRYVRANARKIGDIGYILDMPMNGYRGKGAKFAASCTDSSIGISARTTDDEVDLSIRRRNSNIDLNATVSEVLSEVPLAQGGGHPAAAGASMMSADFPAFLERLARSVESYQKQDDRSP